MGKKYFDRMKRGSNPCPKNLSMLGQPAERVTPGGPCWSGGKEKEGKRDGKDKLSDSGITSERPSPTCNSSSLLVESLGKRGSETGASKKKGGKGRVLFVLKGGGEKISHGEAAG